jgi:DNA-directed RNA polymerase beta' subunit
MLYDHKINYVIRKGTTNRINMKYALYQQGTKLRFGDYVVRNGKYEFIKNERQLPFLQPGDRVLRNGEEIKDFIYPKRKEFVLEIGDTVERKLQDGDIVLLNRQPTQNV